MLTEHQLVNEINNNSLELDEARSKVEKYKSLWIESETQLIGLKLKDAALKDQLRRLRNSSPLVEVDPADEIDEQFRKRLPDLLKKV